MRTSFWLAGATAAGLLLGGCGDVDTDTGSTPSAVPTPAPTSTTAAPQGGDPAVWMLPEQIAAIGMPPPADDAPITVTSSSFTAHVARLACNDGNTGTVLPPTIAWSDTRVVVTFTVDPLPQDRERACPSNDFVPYEVELGEPIGQRELVDGACAAEPARGTSFCADDGVRWRPPGGGADAGASTSAPAYVPASSTPTSGVPAPPVLDLGAVTPESVPMAIAEHLNEVTQFVRAVVGDRVFAGGAFTNDANDEMIVYGTDASAIAAALDQVDTLLRDRITIVETQYSVRDIETYAQDAQRRLDDAGIDAATVIQYGVDAVVVELYTPEGRPDPAIQAAAEDVLGGIPVSIGFMAPPFEL